MRPKFDYVKPIRRLRSRGINGFGGDWAENWQESCSYLYPYRQLHSMCLDAKLWVIEVGKSVSMNAHLNFASTPGIKR